MKVKKLIKMLKKLDPDAVVVVDEDLYAAYDRRFYECKYLRSVYLERNKQEDSGGHRAYLNSTITGIKERTGVVIE